MWIARLTRPDLAFESAAAAQKYGSDQNPNEEYMRDSMEELCDVSADAHGNWSDEITEHMPGFNEFVEENCFVGKFV